MSETIKDGKGRGYLVEVNENHQMFVNSIIQREEVYISDTFGLTYTITTNVVTLNSTNQHLLLYMKNTSATKRLYNATLEIGYNGGSTNHNRCVSLQILAGFTGPTANHTPAVFNNVNFASGNVAEALGYVWDGVGDGMTFSGGGVVNSAVMAKGHQVYDTGGMPIMGLNDYIGIAAVGEEIGTVSVTIRLFYK